MDKITELTKEQEQQLDVFAEQAIKLVNGGDDSYNLEAIENFIAFLYDKKGIPVEVCESPEGLFKAAGRFGYKKEKGESFDYLGLGHDMGWTSFYEFMENIGVDFSDIPEWKEWKKIKDTGIWATLLFENMAFVCIRPCEVKTDTSGNLHNPSGMAIRWKDGTGYYFLDGVNVPDWLVLTHSDQLDAKKILGLENADQRAEGIRKLGIERLASQGKVVDTYKNYDDEWFEKSRYELIDMASIFKSHKHAYYLKMQNQSVPGLWHLEGVAPSCDTLDKAVRWRLKVKEDSKYKIMEIK